MKFDQETKTLLLSQGEKEQMEEMMANHQDVTVSLWDSEGKKSEAVKIGDVIRGKTEWKIEITRKK